MAHIADCMAIPGSPVMGKSAGQYLNTPTSQASFKAFSWRMASEQSQHKAPTYAKDKPLPPINDGRKFEPAPLPNQIFELPEQPERPSTAASTTRPRNNQPLQQNLTRRRKISVPELGPMTTVQESAMDSPTIPGRPAFHERSVSAPDDASGGLKQAANSSQKRTPYSETVDDLSKAIDDAFELINVKDTQMEQAPNATPRRLAPLVIPKSSSPAPRLLPKRSTNHLRSGSTPPMDASRLARMEASPMNYGRFTPDLPYTRPNANEASSSSTLPTPVSAPVVDSHRASPRPWEAYNPPSTSSDRLQSDNNSHRRNISESANIMDRGRPRKRGDARSPPMTKPQDPKQPKSAERRAFEELPQGMKVSEAADKLSQNDMMTLYKQALGQAERFEILKAEDVEALSKELRQLDERTDYLRRTYTSLRSGRRNLHSRICQYLRATRVARFSHESMLKQEEALAELDASIDDWFGKLEHAENRRTRVRQKLLEHVAAASILPVSLAPPNPPHAVIGDVVTPPRSPTKQHSFAPRAGSSSPSPHRVVAQVPSTIFEQPIIEEAAAEKEQANDSPSSVSSKRFDAASLRAYAGDDLFELLTDVEKEITRLSRHADDLLTPKASASAPLPPPLPREQAKDTPSKKQTPTRRDIPTKKEAYAASPEDSPAIHGAYEEDGEYFLTNAVFKP